MDKIWNRKSFEVRSHWPLWRGWKNWMTTRNRQKSNAKKMVTQSQEFMVTPRIYGHSKGIVGIMANWNVPGL